MLAKTNMLSEQCNALKRVFANATLNETNIYKSHAASNASPPAMFTT
jgi:hypothetical protein